MDLTRFLITVALCGLFLGAASAAAPDETDGHIGKPAECEAEPPFCPWGSYALCWCPGEEFDCNWHCVKEK